MLPLTPVAAQQPMVPELQPEWQGGQANKPVDQPEKMMTVLQNADNDIVDVTFYVPGKADVKLEILDEQLNTVNVIIQHEYTNMGDYSKRFRTKKLDSGLYTMAYHMGGQTYYEKWSVK